MNALVKVPPQAIELFDPPSSTVYTIEATAQLVDVPRRAILRYCQRRLLSPTSDPLRSGFYFDRSGIRRLRRIEGLRPLCCDALASIKIILDLMDEVERLNGQRLSREQSANGKSQTGNSTNKEKI
jgi:DNA-binding transcriptional MerR regulator